MKLTILASGSKANAAVLDTGETRILIDAGLSANQIVTRMKLAKLDPAKLDAIFLTHEHNDHTAGLKGIAAAGYNPIPTFANRMTATAIPVTKGPTSNWNIFESGKCFRYRDLHVETFRVSHDAAEPVGFVFIGEDETLGFATDLGCVHAAQLDVLQKCTTLFIEANYSDELMATDKTRPWSVRQRIMSDNGHLSNAQAADAVAELPCLRKAILGHLSNSTNSPDLALSTVARAWARSIDFDIDFALAFTPECDRCKPPQVIEIL